MHLCFFRFNQFRLGLWSFDESLSLKGLSIIHESTEVVSRSGRCLAILELGAVDHKKTTVLRVRLPVDRTTDSDRSPLLDRLEILDGNKDSKAVAAIRRVARDLGKQSVPDGRIDRVRSLMFG